LDQTLAVARTLREIAGETGIPLIFKSSYDKANRTSIHAFRGPGLEEGLGILAQVKASLGIPVLSDVHCRTEVRPASQVLDMIQIPAFLCRQTDLVVAVAGTGLPVNVKKGQFLAPWDMQAVLEKIRSAGNDRVLVTERGVSFGYNNLVVDLRSLVILRRLGASVVFDATHSVQLPGGLGEASGGQREFVPYLARAAVAVGIDALFLEVHHDPEHAPCDGPNSLPLEGLREFLKGIVEIDVAVKKTKSG
jgi:2-dehydro-3-deoxyphosphooctonate aldolase (KDO 8-P synthase)